MSKEVEKIIALAENLSEEELTDLYDYLKVQKRRSGLLFYLKDNEFDYSDAEVEEFLWEWVDDDDEDFWELGVPQLVCQKSYRIGYIDDEGMECFTPLMEKGKAFTEASAMHAFSDCDDTHNDAFVECAHGERFHYVGWQPDMIFEWVDFNGETVWSTQRRDWEH